MMNTTLLVSSSSNKLAVMLENALCVKGFARDREGLATCGEVERNGLVGWGEWIEWMEDVEEVMECVRGEDGQGSSDLSLMVYAKATGLDTLRIRGRVSQSIRRHREEEPFAQDDGFG